MKWRKTAGMLLIVIGCLIAVGLIAYQYCHCVDMWSSEFKWRTFDSFFAYFFSVSKGAILLSLTIGLTAVSAGISLRK